MEVTECRCDYSGSDPLRSKAGSSTATSSSRAAADEELPWGGNQLIIGTGVYGSLPIMPQVDVEAGRRGIDLTAMSTEDACRLIASLDRGEVHAVLHVTC
jgi:hypothetical protein